MKIPADLTHAEWRILRSFVEGEDVDDEECGWALLKFVSSHRDLIHRISLMVPHEHICVVCEKIFFARRDALTCSDKCRQRKSAGGVL